MERRISKPFFNIRYCYRNSRFNARSYFGRAFVLLDNNVDEIIVVVVVVVVEAFVISERLKFPRMTEQHVQIL